MNFRVKVLREPSEEVAYLDIAASDENSARAQAIQLGYSVLTIRQRGYAIGFRLKSRFQLQMFSQEMLSLLSAGLSLVEALEAIADKESNAENRKIFKGILERLYQGLTFSAALQAFPLQFPTLYIAMVRASERTGDLQEVLKRYLDYWEQSDKVRNKIFSASIYPAVILVVGGMVSLFLMLYVIPRFSVIYEDIQGELPFLSRLLLEWGKFIQQNWTVSLLGSIGLVASGIYLVINPKGRSWITQAAMKIPAVQERVRVYQLARLYRSIGMLLRGGIPIIQAFEMSYGVVGRELQARALAASMRIREGMLMSRAMEEHGLVTPIALRMMRVGEKTGSIGEMLERSAIFHEEELARWIDWFMRLFEPILMASIGVIIGGIVVVMYVPIFELASSIQ